MNARRCLLPSPTPERVVKEADKKIKLARREGNPYEKAWVVFDHDRHAHELQPFPHNSLIYAAYQSGAFVNHSGIDLDQYGAGL